MVTSYPPYGHSLELLAEQQAEVYALKSYRSQLRSNFIWKFSRRQASLTNQPRSLRADFQTQTQAISLTGEKSLAYAGEFYDDIISFDTISIPHLINT